MNVNTIIILKNILFWIVLLYDLYILFFNEGGNMETKDVIADLINFRNERQWQEYHTLESLSRALGIEASEVEKIFLWKNSDDQLSEKDLNDLKFELADVLTYVYFMCEKMDLDPNKIVEEKLAINQNRHWKFDKEDK